MKTLLLGIDALDPQVIEEVDTPNIDSIGDGFVIETYGNSGPSWATVMTGVSPDVHGVRRLEPQQTSQTWQGTPIWEKVNGYSGIANVPLTYPPDTDIRGWMVTSLMTPQRSIYTYPPDLYKELDEMGYRIDIWVEEHQNHPHGHYGAVPSEMDDDYRYDLVEQARPVIEKRAECFRWLVQEHPTDFAFLCFTGLDRVQHLAMHDRDVIHEFYELMDDAVGRVLDVIPEGVEIFVTSDHGMQEVDIPTTDITGEHRGPGYGATNTGERFTDLETVHELAVESANRTNVEERLKDLGYVE